MQGNSGEISRPSGRSYRILSPLGQGGFGTVYRARVQGEGGFTKEVALKVLNKDMVGVDDVARRLRDEARVMGLIRHRAIVHVDGLVRLDGRWAIVMEYVEGVDLKACTRNAPLPPSCALEIVSEVAAALHVAYHAKGPEGDALNLLHRDIKPSNIQITTAGEVKLLDFGIARADFNAREAKTQSVLYGSVNYMAPERLDFIEGPEGDIYALGCVLYECLAGQEFGKTSVRENKHAERLGKCLDDLFPRIRHEEMIDLVREMISYEPEDRPTAREVERRCAQMRARLVDAVLLRDWSEEVVPTLMTEREAMPLDQLSGSTLAEDIGGRTGGGTQWFDDGHTGQTGVPLEREGNTGATMAPYLDEEGEVQEQAPHKRPKKAKKGGGGMMVAMAGATTALVGGGVILALAAVAIAVVVVIVVMQPQTGTTKDPVDVDPDTQVTPPDTETTPPDTDAGTSDDTDSDAVAATDDTDAATQDTRPKDPPPKDPVHTSDTRPKDPPPKDPGTTTDTRPKDPPPKDPPPKDPIGTASSGAMGTVNVTGDAAKVFVVDNAGKRFRIPGDVPEGTYKVWAAFDGKAAEAGLVRVREGKNVTVNCAAMFQRCTPK